MTDGWSEARLAAGRRAWRFSLAGTLVSSLGGGLTLPFLFVYLHGVRHLPLPLVGAIVATGAVAAFALSPVSGAIGDRIGLGRMLVAGLLTSSLGTTTLGLQAGALGAFIAVAVAAAGDTLVYPSLNGLVAAQLPQKSRQRAYALRFGLLNAGTGVGGLVSGFVVSISHPGSFELVYLLDAGGTIVFAGIAVVGMRGSPGFSSTRSTRTRNEGDRGRERTGYLAVLSNRPFVGFLVCTFVFELFGYAQLNGPWAEYATAVIGTGPRTVGIAFAANTAAIVICQLLVSRLTSRWRRSRLLLGTGVLWVAAWSATGLAGLPGVPATVVVVVLVASLAVFGLGETFFSPVVGGLPNELAEEHLRGRYNAASSGAWSIARFIGPPLAGLLLGGSVPSVWVLAIAFGMAFASVGAALLGRLLPSAIDRPGFAPR